MIFCDESGSGIPLKQALENIDTARTPHIDIIIGPEGGFADNEREQLSSLSQSVAVGMGERIMKADTAMIAALSSLQLMLGGWSNPPRFIP